MCRLVRPRSSPAPPPAITANDPDPLDPGSPPAPAIAADDRAGAAQGPASIGTPADVVGLDPDDADVAVVVVENRLGLMAASAPRGASARGTEVVLR